MEIKWSILAKEDLNNFYSMARIGTKENIKKYLLNLINYTNYLSQNPFLGRILFIHNNLEYHILIYKKHKILYTITDYINIVAVVHSSRDINPIINKIKSI